MKTQYTIMYIGEKHDKNVIDFTKGQRYDTIADAERFLEEIGKKLSYKYYKINESKLYIIDENDELKWCRAFITEV